MRESIFEYSDYKNYLRDKLPTQGAERGIRSRLAQKLSCKPAFVTQVLQGKVHFSLEHAIEIDHFFGHATYESQYFMLMVFRGKAGSKNLENFFSEQMELLRRERARIVNQVNASRVDRDLEQRYFSSWIYSAVHALLMLPGFSSEQQIASRLGISVKAALEALEFLLSAGLAEKKDDWHATQRRIHLSESSPMIQNHHTNWRLRAIDALRSGNPLNLHYSGPITLSRENAQKVRALFLKFIKDLEPILASPEEEEIYGIALDLFSL